MNFKTKILVAGMIIGLMVTVGIVTAQKGGDDKKVKTTETVKVIKKDGETEVTITTKVNGKKETKVLTGEEAEAYLAERGHGEHGDHGDHHGMKIKMAVSGDGEDGDEDFTWVFDSDELGDLDINEWTEKMKDGEHSGHTIMISIDDDGNKKVVKSGTKGLHIDLKDLEGLEGLENMDLENLDLDELLKNLDIDIDIDVNEDDESGTKKKKVIKKKIIIETDEKDEEK